MTSFQSPWKYILFPISFHLPFRVNEGKYVGPNSIYPAMHAVCTRVTVVKCSAIDIAVVAQPTLIGLSALFRKNNTDVAQLRSKDLPLPPSS